jgi:hypothetical protein
MVAVMFSVGSSVMGLAGLELLGGAGDGSGKGLVAGVGDERDDGSCRETHIRVFKKVLVLKRKRLMS